MPIADTKICGQIHDDNGLQCQLKEPQFLQVDNFRPAQPINKAN